MKTSLVALMALATPAGPARRAEADQLLDMHHVDIQVNYAPPSAPTEISPNGGWNNGMVVEEGEDPNFPGDGTGQGGFYQSSAFTLLVTPLSLDTRPAGAAYDFLGVDPGASFYHLRQGNFENIQNYQGVTASDDLNPADFGAWNPNDPRALGSEKWLQVNLVGFRGPSGGNFSIWDSPTLGGSPTVWFSTVNGVDSNDAIFSVVGSHKHSNTGFSKAGDYDIDLSVTTTLADGSVSTSPVTKYHFQVRAVPEPASLGLIAVGGGAFLLRLRRRKS